MTIIVQPLLPTDFPALQSHADSPAGDLHQPLIPLYWPAPHDNATAGRNARLKWSLKHQELQLISDPTAHVRKAVDSETGEILSIARWHYYENGWDSDKMLWREIDHEEGERKADDIRGANLPEGGKGEYEDFKRDMHVDVWRWFGRMRSRSMQGPCWILCTLITRAGHRNKGAGSALLQWGCDQADAARLPAYLESLPLAKSLYEKFGFREQGLMEFDTKPYGGEQPLIVAIMKREPKISGKKD